MLFYTHFYKQRLKYQSVDFEINKQQESRLAKTKHTIITQKLQKLGHKMIIVIELILETWIFFIKVPKLANQFLVSIPPKLSILKVYFFEL